ncbi:monocarboxylate transporter [Moesziomyces antarcticus]|uniref:Related to Monocarboxylate transporter 1 n=1 Tax=Pseudozyma antarctica TaxID=84753 RepID=A0A5C3FGU6_PSEA2|nr:monocarboxylate transporter [Moesziomyces antarcticus]GAK62185.1 monocarboxylate transporter [Moesziomyces antarcticus]SPO42721.1 related to Monocarboxylate transporter 1 [Moesziomyces antarcticus]
MESSRSSDEQCSSCSTSAPSPPHSSFASEDSTAVNTAVPTRRNSLSLAAHLSSTVPGTATPQKSPRSVHGGVSPKCLAQRLLQQQQPSSNASKGMSEHIDTCPNTLVANSPRTSLDKLERAKLDVDEIDKIERDIEKVVTEPGPAPDGGLQAWLVVAGTFVLIMTNFGLLTSYGVFQSYYLSHQLAHLPSSTVSWIGSLQTFMILGGSFVFGKLSDDYGSRWVVVCGSVITFISMLCVSFCTTLVQLIMVQGVAFGLGGSMLFLPGCALVNQYFDRKKGTAMSVIIGAASFGGIIWPLILQALFDHPKIGFAWGVRIAALLLAILLTISNVLMRPRLPPNKPGMRQPWSQAWTLLTTDVRTYTLFVVGTGVLFINFFVPFFTIASYAKRVGFSPAMATHMVAIMNAASMVGRLVSGPLADRYGRFNVLSLFGLSSVLALILFWPIPGLTLTKAGVVTLSITYGVASGGSIATVSSCVAQISPKHAGARLGLMWTIAAPGTLVGPVISTTLVNKMDGKYTALAIWAAGTTLVGSIIITRVRFHLAKGQWRAKV